MRRLIASAGALLVIGAGMAPAVATESPEPSPSPDTKIEPRLAREFESAGGSDFWVRFDEHADLGEAGRIDDWDARGAQVARVLRETAEASQAGVRARLDADGVEYESFWATNAIYIQNGSGELANELAARPEVESLRPTTQYEIPEPEESTGTLATLSDSVEWGIADINADDVWEQYDARGEGIVIANIDSGVQYDHPAVVNQYRGNNGDGTFDHDYNWFDAAGVCADAPCDGHGHGTHTMGTMVGDDGGENQIGVAPEVTWIAANGCCPNDFALIASGQWMLEPTDLDGDNPDASKRPDIINNSWGTRSPSNNPFMEDIALAWEASGIFAVWSNGNSGPGCQTSGSPGSRIINYSVGAHDAGHDIADFSSRGAGQDGEIKPNLAAPGVDVVSARAEGTSMPGAVHVRDGYTQISGTSMAAPHVAGAVALAWSAAPGLVGDIDGTRSLLDGTAIDTPVDGADEACGGTDEKNNVFGEGRLDALALLDAAPVGGTGTLAATVTDASTGDPISGAELTVAGPVDRDRVTDEDGSYTLPLPPGDYTVTVSAFGYHEQTTDVTITTGETTTEPIALEALPMVTVGGRVTDGSGHGWPLYAGITVEGMPDGTVHTRPVNGRYRLTVPADDTYTIEVESQYDGYQTVTEELVVGDGDVTHDIAVPVDDEACVNGGYEHAFDGMLETFDAEVLPAGWEVIDNSGSGHSWQFDNPRGRDNMTGGEGGFASAERTSGISGELDSSLVTPVVDLTGHEAPILRFRQDLTRILAIARVELSVDGGATWETLLEQDSNVRGPDEQIIPIPQAADQPEVQVRFRMFNHTIFSTRFWQVDDVFVGTRSCEPAPTGLVLGNVTDHNTGEPVNGATVTSDDIPEETTRSVATPDDPALDDGFYWIFSSASGRPAFTAEIDRYEPRTLRNKPVGDSAVTEHNFRLKAGRLEVEPEDLTADVREGRSTKVSFTVTNTGSAPAEVRFRERDGQYEIPRSDVSAQANGATASGSADIMRVPGEFSPLRGGGPGADIESVAPDSWRTGSTAGPWIDLPAYPTRVMDNAVGEHDGKIYSVGGMVDGVQLTEGYVYDPADESWSRIADLPEPLQAAAGAFIGGKFYVAGGWPPLSQGSRAVYIYDPETDSWSRGADAPFIFAAAGRAVLDGQLYIVGGCTNACRTSRVFRYDPPSDSWDELASYPEPTSHEACGGIAGQLYCAGGTRTGGVIFDQTYAYDPATDTWTRKADLPIPLWGMSYTVSSERLLVSGGVTGGRPDLGEPAEPTSLTNEGFVYDPVADTWTSLPASNNATYRAGNTCGLTKIGGTIVVGFAMVDAAELLPTYGDCVPADVPWLSLDTDVVTLDPGRKTKVKLTLDASDNEPGSYDGGVWISQDTPYLTYPVDVTMTVESSRGGPPDRPGQFPVITTEALPPWSVLETYRTAMSVEGGRPPYTWSAEGLPDGLVVDSSTGVISQDGSDTEPSSATVTLTVTDDKGRTDTAELQLDTAMVDRMAAGDDHVCALTTDTAVYCWGRNISGQLGNGTLEDSSSPVPVVDPDDPENVLRGVVDISAGQAHTCAVTEAGTAYCWGFNGAGRLGLGHENAESVTVPSQVAGPGGIGNLGGVEEISAGALHTCALTGSEIAYCWGDNFRGQIGAPGQVGGVPTSVRHPADASEPLTGLSAIGTGTFHTCAATTEGTGYCWGWNHVGQLGTGQTFPIQSTIPLTIADPDDPDQPLTGLDRVEAGSFHACAATSSGAGYCWGQNAHGQVGNGDAPTNIAIPSPIADPADPASALAGLRSVGPALIHSCGVTTDDTAYCWGNNSEGQLGDGTTTTTDLPVQVADPDDANAPFGDVATLVQDGWQTCVVTTVGLPYCWGDNRFGQLGDGTNENRLLPTRVRPG